MTTREQIKALVDAALDEVNELLPPDGRVQKTPDARLLAADGKLDSMSAITLVVAISSGLVRQFGHSAGLTEDPRAFEPDGPMRSVSTLVDFIEGLHPERPMS